MLIMFLYYK